MKEGWTFLNFEDCIEKCKKTKQLKTSDYLPEGKYPIVSQESDLISGYTNMADYVNDFGKPIVVFGDHSRVVKYIDFAFAVGADGVKILIPTNDFHPKFFYYYLHWHGVENLGYSRHYKLLKEINVPIPTLSEQQHIVEELDLLSSIIEKKKAQLNELDNLAQSLFYEMFGDPITNEKGWEVRKLNDIYKLKSGDGLSAKNFVEGIYPVYGGNGISGYHNAYNMNGDFIIIGRVGAYCGNVRYVKGLFWLTDNAFQLFFDANIQTPIFVLYLLTLLDLHRFANEAAQPVISNKTLRDLDIIIPTMEMQEQFASKIETIEHQKELIKKSIKEVETLLNSRMDYYFN